MQKCNEVFVGFSTDVVPDWGTWVPSPKAPSNYRDPEKIAEYVNKASLTIKDDMAQLPVSGVVRDAYAVDSSGKMVFRGDGVDFYKWLCGSRVPLVYAVSVGNRVKQCATAAALTGDLQDSWGLYGSHVTLDVAAVETVYPPQLYDPVKLLGHDIETLLNYMRRELPDTKLTLPFEANPVELQAEFVRRLALKFGFTKPWY